MTIFWVQYPLNIDELLTQLFLWFTNNVQHICIQTVTHKNCLQIISLLIHLILLNIFNLKWYYVACTFTFKCIIYMHKLIHCTTLLILFLLYAVCIMCKVSKLSLCIEYSDCLMHLPKKKKNLQSMKYSKCNGLSLTFVLQMNWNYQL